MKKQVKVDALCASTFCPAMGELWRLALRASALPDILGGHGFMAISSAARHNALPPLIGCAGWSIPSTVRASFPGAGSQLERYAAVFSAVEINTSFYRPHRPATYARWRDSVPPSFRFSAKLPKLITHQLRLRDTAEALRRFIDEVSHLEEKLGCLLVQLPPSLPFDALVVEKFFDLLRALTKVDVVCEPRHRSWFAVGAAEMLAAAGVAYVIADPSPVDEPLPTVDTGTVYIRLHGSPVMYYSAYADDYLDRLAIDIADRKRAGKRVWCIFDNTANGAAVPNGLALMSRLRGWPGSATGIAEPACIQNG